MLNRQLNILLSNSFFIFGARGTGKTKLINHLLSDKNTLFIDLLDPLVLDSYSLHPNRLVEHAITLKDKTGWIAIDEVQKLPKLLDLVHKCIEEHKIKFALTGSSARKLKRGAANLLAGRAFVYHLYPFTSEELGEHFDLQTALEWGTLPKILELTTEQEKEIYLRTYTQTYLQEEILAEQIIRKLDPFRLFLQVVGQTNSQIINYANIGRDVGVSTVTVQSYFQILEDTLIGINLPPFHTSIRKRINENPKFYLFDCGVQRALSRTLNIKLAPQTYAYGKAFENFIINEIYKLQNYQRKDYQLSYLRTKDNAEIDLVIERPGMPLAIIEIKSTNKVREDDLRSLQRFHKDLKKCESFCLSNDPLPRKIGSVSALPWQLGLKEIGL